MENINEHDMTKNMLDKLRNLPTTRMNENVEVPEENEVINEHDMTKRMLDTIRQPIINEAIKRSGMLLTEEGEGQVGMDSKVQSDGEEETRQEDVVKVEDDELGEEAAKLRDVVGGVDLKLYEVYPQAQNVVMVGVLDNGIEFKFSKKEGAAYINVNNLRLDSDSVDMVKKLQGYYVNWTQFWAEKIGEYSNSV